MTEKELLDRIRLRPRKIIVGKPKLMGMRAVARSDGGIYYPDIANRGRREWGMLARVLKTGEGCVEDGVIPGAIVLLTEFAGMPIYYAETVHNLWLAALGDVVGVITDPEGVEIEGE